MTFFIVVHAFICVFLVLVILLQPGKSDSGIGFGSSSQSIFGSRGAGNFLTKATSVCAVMFLFTSLILTRSRLREFGKSVITPQDAAADKKAAPSSGPANPDSKTGGSKDDKAESKKAEPEKK